MSLHNSYMQPFDPGALGLLLFKERECCFFRREKSWPPGFKGSAFKERKSHNPASKAIVFKDRAFSDAKDLPVHGDFAKISLSDLRIDSWQVRLNHVSELAVDPR